METIADASWAAALEAVLAGRVVPVIHFQPIVDIQHGHIAGFEALARFPGPPTASPDRWLAAAEGRGLRVAIEAVLTAAALRSVEDLPANTFLTVNTSPAFLASSEWQVLTNERRDLTRVGIELTENEAVTDYDFIRVALARARDRGAWFCVDDLGSGYSSMQHVLALRPDFVKIDRQFVTGCERDAAKSAMIEAIGSLAGQLDAWIVAEGVERPEELDCLMRLGVPLAQGYYLCRPLPPWPELSMDALLQLTRSKRRAVDRATVGSLSERLPTLDDRGPQRDVHPFQRDAGLEYVVVVDSFDRPVTLISRAAWVHQEAGRHKPMRVKATSALAGVARRAMTRPAATRFDPVICIEDDGSYVGVVRIEHLVHALTDDGVVRKKS